MKIKITMKDPDGVFDSVKEAVQREVEKLQLPEDEAESLIELRTEKTNKLLRKWFESGEYLTVEVDTEAETCTVEERS